MENICHTCIHITLCISVKFCTMVVPKRCKIWYFGQNFHFGSIAYIFSKIVNNHGIIFILMHKQKRPIYCDFCREFGYFNLKYQFVNIYIWASYKIIFIKVITKPCAKYYTDASRKMDSTNISQFLAISAHNLTFPQKIFNVGSILLCII